MYADTSIRLQAHKGYSLYTPENTLAAFRAACDAGYEFIELDPKFTADGVCVLIHDWTVNRTGRTKSGEALPSDTRVDALTMAELRELDFGVWFSEEFRGETVPTFEEAIPYILSRGVSVKVDNVWERFSHKQQKALFALVRRIGAVHPETGAKIGMTCARLENVARVARELPEAAIHYDGLVDDAALTALDESASGRELYIWLRFHNAKTAWNPNPPVDAAYAEKVKAHGRLGIWLIDDPAEMPAVREFAPYVVETNGGVRPS
ncbi:MAG: hypothetical protein J6J01_00880 [Oscillospiraceae bacterium]|nr:hypothetical protein [Oscillospiraceae bacterium]